MELVFFLIRCAQTWIFLLALFSYSQVFAQHSSHSNRPWPPEGLPALTELPLQFPTSIELSTDSSDAQLFFNYGLTALHSFAYLEAYRSFQHVQQLEPNNPMGAWGKAYSILGTGKTGEQLDAVIAQAIAKLDGANDIERSYIRALTAYTQSDAAYIKALELLIEENPNELDAKLLLAFFMNDGYDHRGQPLKNQAYAKAILGPLLKDYPNHLGLHHYWIHATEASKYPQRAKSSLIVLENAKSKFGHIVHMPGHMAWLDRDYFKASAHFRAAETTDLKFLEETKIDPADYWSYFHNMAYLLVAELETGDLDAARKTIKRVEDTYQKAASAAANSALVQYRADFSARVFSRVGDWQSFEKQLRSTPLENPIQQVRHLHSSVALVLNQDPSKLDENQRTDTEKTLKELRELVSNGSDHALSQTLLYEAEAVFQAMKGDGKAAISNFKKAILWESKIPYEEPPLRMRTVHETAGQTFCFFGAFDAGISMYQQATQTRANNGFAMQGLVSCLKRKGAHEHAEEYQAKLDKLWQRP